MDSYQVNTFDNLDRVIEVDRHDVSTGYLIAQNNTYFDNLGRVYKTTVTAVDPGSGGTGNTLASNTWYDPAGNVAKSLPAGSLAFTKTKYDSVNRAIGRYVGYYTATEPESYANAITITANNKIFEQTLTTFDDASNVLQVAAYQRWDTATGNNVLGNPTTQPYARISFMALWQDGVGRQVAMANYGTNGNAASLTRPDLPPASSASVLVSLTQYNERAEAFLSTDPAGKVMRVDSDDAGRSIRTTDNYVAPGPCPTCGRLCACDCNCGCEMLSTDGCPQPGNDQNVIVETTYNADSLVPYVDRQESDHRRSDDALPIRHDAGRFGRRPQRSVGRGNLSRRQRLGRPGELRL